MGIKREQAHKSIIANILAKHSSVDHEDSGVAVCAGDGCSYSFETDGTLQEISEHQADVLWKEGIRP